MKILSINDFLNKLLSNFHRDLSNRVHLQIVSKFINKVINRHYFCKCTLTKKLSVNNFFNKLANNLYIDPIRKIPKKIMMKFVSSH